MDTWKPSGRLGPRPHVVAASMASAGIAVGAAYSAIAVMVPLEGLVSLILVAVAGAEPLLSLRVPTRAQLEALRTIADALREADHAVHQPSPASRG
jgi:hypothetical protein